MRDSPGIRGLLRTLGNAAVGVGLGIAVYGAAIVIAQVPVADVASALPQALPPALLAAPSVTVGARTSTPAPRTAQPTAPPTPSPTPSPSPSPTATPTPTGTPTRDPLTATAYSSGGRRYAALHAPVGYVLAAPFAGTVEVRTYQLIEGEVRVGSNLPALPFYPYVTLVSADRRLVLRPGAAGADTELLVKDGEQVATGAPLFRIAGGGASSWRAFYDRSLTANVVASLAALPGGAELDPVPLFSAL